MLSKLFNREKWGLRVVKANQLFSRPIGMLAAISLMILIVFIYFAIDNQHILKEIRRAATNTETIVGKQDETLEAIRQVAIDNKITSDQKTDIIICMLQVPVNQRTTDTKEQCREQAESSPPTIQSRPTQQSTSTPQPATTQPPSTTSNPADTPNQPPQDSRSNLERVTDRVGRTVCRLPVLGTSRACD